MFPSPCFPFVTLIYHMTKYAARFVTNCATGYSVICAIRFQSCNTNAWPVCHRRMGVALYHVLLTARNTVRLLLVLLLRWKALVVVVRRRWRRSFHWRRVPTRPELAAVGDWRSAVQVTTNLLNLTSSDRLHLPQRIRSLNITSLNITQFRLVV